MLELWLRGSRREYREQPGMWAEHKHSADAVTLQCARHETPIPVPYGT
jgi:hypothetical protein